MRVGSARVETAPEFPLAERGAEARDSELQPDVKLRRLIPKPASMSGRKHQRDTEARRRTEPTLGNLDQLDERRPPAADELPIVVAEARRPRAPAPAPKPRPKQKPRRGGRGWLVVASLLVLVVAAGGLWSQQDVLRSWLPRTDFNDVLGRAQQALKAGHLDGQDGTSARELFQQAVALEPDNDRASDGLHEVGRAELSQADAALQSGQFSQAAQKAALARELLGGGSDVDRLDREISRAQAAQVQIVDLVDQAQQAVAAGKLTGKDGAGALYQRVLRADPGNAVAAHGLDQVGAGLSMQARRAFDAGDQAAADQSIDALAALQPGNGALPALRAQQAQQQKQNSQALDTAVRQGTEAIRAGRITGAGDDTALAHFKAALALDPDNPRARAGLGDVAQALTVQANAAIDAGNAGRAKYLLDQAATLAPKSADLAAARARLASKLRPPMQQALPDSDVASPAASAGSPMQQAPMQQAPMQQAPMQQAAVSKLVQRAQSAASHGQIMLPPGTSAYDLYRNALAIDGNSQAALNGLQGLPALVRKRFEQALAASQLAQADEALGNLHELAPGDASNNVLGRRLASAWLDQAEQQLDRGDSFNARHSLKQAQRLAPGSPRAQDLAARLRSGG